LRDTSYPSYGIWRQNPSVLAFDGIQLDIVDHVSPFTEQNSELIPDSWIGSRSNRAGWQIASFKGLTGLVPATTKPGDLLCRTWEHSPYQAYILRNAIRRGMLDQRPVEKRLGCSSRRVFSDLYYPLDTVALSNLHHSRVVGTSSSNSIHLPQIFYYWTWYINSCPSL
jgi:hypothetical protein